MALTNAGARVCLVGPGLVSETRYFGLFVGQPSQSGVEVSVGGYGRLARTPAQMVVTDNEVSISMGEWEAVAQARYGGVTWVGMYTSFTGGVLLADGELNPTPTPIVAGARVYMDSGDITITIPLS